MGGSGDHWAASEAFLASTDVVDWHHPAVRTLAWLLAAGVHEPVEIAKRCFEWVRDEIRHSVDANDTVVTCAASEVLAHRTGLCYAKSHLLAALLRANGVPTGFCYQRLSIDGIGPPYCLHGLVAAHLKPFGWYRIDPRGNKPGVNTQFSPPREYLAFNPQLPGEFTLPDVFREPLPAVVKPLYRYATIEDVLAHLPDLACPSNQDAPVGGPHFRSVWGANANRI